MTKSTDREAGTASASASNAIPSSSSSTAEDSSSAYPLLANKAQCCRICLDDDPHGLYSPCRCRGSIKFVHSHCLTRWRKSLMAHGRDESANSCTMCGFNYVLKKRARFYELLSYRGIRIAITVLVVLAMLFPSGYLMKVCVLLSGYRESNPGTSPGQYLGSLRNISSNMEHMSVFPVCKVNSLGQRPRLRVKLMASTMNSAAAPASILDSVPGPDGGLSSSPAAAATTSVPGAPLASPSHFVNLFPGPYAPHLSNSNVLATRNDGNGNGNINNGQGSVRVSGSSTQKESESTKQRMGQGPSSWAWVAAGIDIMGSSQFAAMLLYPFVNDRIWYFLLCRLQHLHLGFFLLGSASNVYMACKMLSDIYDLVITPPHSRTIKKIFMAQTSIFVVWFWFSYNLMAFRVSTTEEEFMSELPLWALRWINVGVAIVDLSYRRVYNRLGRLKVEEELLDISDVEKVEQMHQTAWLHQQQRFLQFGQEQTQYLLDQFKSLEVRQSIVNGASAAVDAVSDVYVYSKTSIPSFPPIPNSIASAVRENSSTMSFSSFLADCEEARHPFVSATAAVEEAADMANGQQQDETTGISFGKSAESAPIR
ncbi:hypothetical protein EC957_008383 [Mortierella hygrophila]|uniref:RING-CH-type domain-containing protein n=1 Tax=Mortierella hygrophila TaxID=979708 RepID=A0A9P6JY46_9FUNG|nr:hypothetical protein EC957_008383 [Mortierella hygrophila]